MAFDDALACRIRRAVGPRPDVRERRMFGGLAFLHDGRMFVGVIGDELMVRVGAAAHAESLARPHARPMDFTGKPMTGYVFVAASGARDGRAVGRWVARALAHVVTLPPRKAPKRRLPAPRPARPRR